MTPEPRRSEAQMLGQAAFDELEQALSLERRYAAATDGLLTLLRSSVALEAAWPVVVQTFAEQVVSAVAEGEMLKSQMTVLSRFARHVPANTIALGREISDAMVEAGAYKL